MKNKFYSKTCVGLDIETTDLDPHKGELIEVAAVKFGAGEIIDEYQSLIKPRGKIPAVVQAITGITEQDVKKAPELSNIRNDFSNFVGDYPIVGHNINFDINFLNEKGFNFKNKRYDTWKLATLLIPNLPSHSLEALTDFFNIKHVESHRALDDVLASIDLFNLLVTKIYQVDPYILKEIIKKIKQQGWAMEDIFKELVRKIPKVSGRIKTKVNEPKNIKNTSQIIKNIDSFFRNKEKIKRKFKQYEYRPAQVKLLKSILNNLEINSDVITYIEPGVGKELAYLASSVYYAKNSSENIFIAVEDFKKIREIMGNSVGVLKKILPFSFKSSILTSRNNYLCLRRFDHFKKQKKFSQTELNSLIKLMLWEPTTKTGNIQETANLYEDEPIFKRVNCNHAYCSKEECPFFKECYYYKSLNQAKKSDIILGDQAAYVEYFIKYNQKVAPNIIIDRSYQLEQSYQEYCGKELSDLIINDKLAYLLQELGILSDLLIKGKRQKQIKQIVKNLSAEVKIIQNQVVLFFGILGIFINKQEFKYGFKQIIVNDSVGDLSGWQEVGKASKNLINSLNKTVFQINKLASLIKAKKYRDIQLELIGVNKEIYSFITQIQLLSLNEESSTPLWLEESFQGVKLISKPRQIDFEKISTTLKNNQSHNFLVTASIADREREFIKNKLQITDLVKEVIIKKTKKSINLLKMLMPLDIVNPNSSDFNHQAGLLINEVAKEIKGGVVISVPSRSFAETIYQKIALNLKNSGVEVYAQGVNGSQDKVYQKFMAEKESVLIANHQMLFNRDIPADRIKCLIMAKIPFEMSPVPENKQEGNNFNDFSEKTLPQAIFKYLKIFQRFNKNRTKKGIFINLDERLLSANYGDDFLKSLPDITIEQAEMDKIAGEAEKWLNKADD